jgi:hypothetical protein
MVQFRVFHEPSPSKFSSRRFFERWDQSEMRIQLQPRTASTEKRRRSHRDPRRLRTAAFRTRTRPCKRSWCRRNKRRTFLLL